MMPDAGSFPLVEADLLYRHLNTIFESTDSR
jgi:hypothetical protein